MNRASAFALLGALAASTSLAAQQTAGKAGESYFGTTFSVEKDDISAGCSTTQKIIKDGKEQIEKKPLKVWVPGCLVPMVHGNKGLYPSVANLPPGNGLALGAVFKDTELNPRSLPSWRFDYQVDAQGSFNGSWTAGGFLTMKLAPVSQRTAQPTPATGEGTTGSSTSAAANSKKPTVWLHPPIVVQGPIPKRLPNLGENETKLLLNFYAFHTALNQVTFYGIGPDTVPADRSFFGFRETVTGANADVLLPWGFHFLGELNGRWPEIGPRGGQSSPSIDQVYSEATAPGLSRQPGFVQPGEGLQFLHHGGGLGQDANFGASYDLDWSVNFQQFLAPSLSTYSFRRLTIDATNEIHLKKRFTPKEGASTEETFGTLQLRGWLSESIVPAGHVVPFYFQPTLGGGDIDKQRALASYPDYRFRAPEAVLFRALYEHPLPKYSFLGLLFRADSGKVAITRGNLDLSHLRHSYGAGFTVRALDFPYLIFMYAWGGAEGSHTIADVNASAIAAGGGPTSLW